MESDVKMHQHEKDLKLQNFTPIYKAKGKKEGGWGVGVVLKIHCS